MLPSLMLSLAQGKGKVFQTFKPQTSPEEKVGDRKAGCISYRRQLWRIELKTEKCKPARFQPHWGRQDGKAVKESKFKKKAQGKKSCQLISSAQERGLSTAARSDLSKCPSCVRAQDGSVSCWCFPDPTANWFRQLSKQKNYWIFFFFFQFGNFSFVFVNFLVFSLNCLTIRQTLCWGKASAWLELCLLQLWPKPASTVTETHPRCFLSLAWNLQAWVSVSCFRAIASCTLGISSSSKLVFSRATKQTSQT